MLTKEEANEFYAIIGGCWIENPTCDGCKFTRQLVHKMQDKIKKLTEKPKREIQVGDIYKNMAGSPEIILRTDFTAPKPVIGIRFNYDLNGKHFTNQDSPHDLDLSQRYKLVEVDGDE